MLNCLRILLSADATDSCSPYDVIQLSILLYYHSHVFCCYLLVFTARVIYFDFRSGLVVLVDIYLIMLVRVCRSLLRNPLACYSTIEKKNVVVVPRTYEINIQKFSALECQL